MPARLLSGHLLRRRLPPRAVRAVAAGVAGLMLAGGLPAVAVAQPASMPVPVPPAGLSAPAEAPARYVGQVACDPVERPGTVALRALLLGTYAIGRDGGITRACSSGGTSEHKDGRAWDWMLDVRKPTEAAAAQAFLSWLVGPDAAGVPAGNAHRLGVMYVIWDSRTWQAWTGAWKPYTGASPHTDHIHISLSWDGAMKRTSWWTGVRVETPDVGPCRVYVGEPAPAYTGPRTAPCPPAVPRQAPSYPRLWDADPYSDVLARTASGAMLLYPGTGSGGFGRSRQVSTGWAGRNLTATVGDFDRDGHRDLLGRGTDGRLYLYRGDGRGGFLSAAQVGRGWGGFDVVVGPGDLDGDGTVDVLTRTRVDGRLTLYPGDGAAGFGRPVVLGSLPGAGLLTPVGDFSGDGRPDLVSRDAAGRLLLHAGTGRAALAPARAIGRGWGAINTIVGTGDFDGDRKADLVARRTDGQLWLYAGNGAGGFASARQIGRGWGALALTP